MDLRLYYQKIRDKQAEIGQAFPVIVSHETPDGGKAGTLTEVPAAIGAKMLVDGIARLARREEAEEFHLARAAAKQAVEAAMEAAKVRLSVLPTALLNQLQSAAFPAKDRE
jgi:hypothetical protein